MKKKTLVTTIAASMLAFSSLSIADSGAKELEATLKENMPWLEIMRIDASPVENFYFVDFDQGAAVISKDGQYLFTGELINLHTQQNLTELRKAVFNKEILKEISEEDLVVYKADNEVSYITVFTDPTCPYCQLMHNEVEKLNEMGITVKYVMYPRGNSQGPGFEMVRAVMHAEDKKAAIDHIKENENIIGFEFDKKSGGEQTEVVLKIDEIYEIGNRLGVTGTPSVFLENGLQVPGYREAGELKAIVDEVIFGIMPE